MVAKFDFCLNISQYNYNIKKYVLHDLQQKKHVDNK
jgi:hypothetical protein